MRRGDRGSPDTMPEKKPAKPPKAPLEPSFAPHKGAQRAALKTVAEHVASRAAELIDRYVQGESMDSLAATLPVKVSGWSLRNLLAENPETALAYKSANLNRAHALVERSLELAQKAGELGEAAGYRVAVDTYIKVAGKLAPEVYGEKQRVELTGADGGAIETKADVTLSPADAYERLIGKA